ncbi:MAG TPA: RNA pyrophosphohydrolase [Methyloceanibacter sp.]|nr:RNA pyrophosphohydrolase [Methyloceanibacter sp.]
MTEPEGLPYRPCVGVMLIDARGRVFVGRRSDRPDAPEGAGHWWQMPQGGLDEGEDPETAARRELEEETGVRSVRFIARTRDWLVYDLPSHLVGVAWEGRYRGQKQMWFAGRFEGDESEIDLVPREGHEQEFDAWRWVEAAELPGLVVPFKRQVYARVVEEFEPLLRGLRD